MKNVKYATSILGSIRASLGLPEWLVTPPRVTTTLTAYRRLDAETRQALSTLHRLHSETPDVELADIRAASAAIKAGEPEPKKSLLDDHLAKIGKAEGRALAHQHALRQAEAELLQAIFDARPEWQRTAQDDADAATENYREALAALVDAVEKLNRARSVVSWLARVTTTTPQFSKPPIGGFDRVVAFLDQLAVDPRPDARSVPPPTPTPLEPEVPTHLVDRMTAPSPSGLFAS